MKKADIADAIVLSFDKRTIAVYITVKQNEGGVTVSTGTFEVVEACRGSYRPR
jgi:tetrahydromethanopterin S-methyltransferase subunit H